MDRSIVDNPHGGDRVNSPKRIIIHSMAEFIEGDHAVNFIQNVVKLSAHALIDPSGHIYRLRNDRQSAWHARGFNKDSLGLEFLVTGEHTYGSFIDIIKRPYITDAEYQAGVEQVKEWCSLYPIESIDRHSDVSPGRKVDPGEGFPWDEFLADVGMH